MWRIQVGCWSVWEFTDYRYYQNIPMKCLVNIPSASTFLAAVEPLLFECIVILCDCSCSLISVLPFLYLDILTNECSLLYAPSHLFSFVCFFFAPKLYSSFPFPFLPFPSLFFPLYYARLNLFWVLKWKWELKKAFFPPFVSTENSSQDVKMDWDLVSSADVQKDGDDGVLRYIVTVKDDWYHRNYTPRIVTKVGGV